MPGELMWEQGRPPHVCSRLGRCYWLSLRPTWPSSTMTFIQPFASPEVDLEGMCLTAFICPLYYYCPPTRVFPPFIFPLVLFSRFCMCALPPLHPPTPPFCLSLGCTAEGSKCKSSRAVFFRRALISADDVSKEVTGTTQRPTQLLSPIHRLQIYVSPSLFFPSFSPTLALFPTTFSTLSISIGPCT